MGAADRESASHHADIWLGFGDSASSDIVDWLRKEELSQVVIFR